MHDSLRYVDVSFAYSISLITLLVKRCRLKSFRIYPHRKRCCTRQDCGKLQLSAPSSHKYWSGVYLAGIAECVKKLQCRLSSQASQCGTLTLSTLSAHATQKYSLFIFSERLMKCGKSRKNGHQNITANVPCIAEQYEAGGIQTAPSFGQHPGNTWS